ncbi:MAG: DNA polymerase III subunit gamma/tau [Pseudanabaena sp. RU_4_16]|nr:DNA polymerase III subunit gamma/tau [Pseudanabaena sp. RU_4_16]
MATTLTNAIKTQRIAPAYLLTGARGTGKTSTARIMAKSLNCRSYDVPTPTPCGKCDLCHGVTVGNALDITEIDAASNTGVDNIRELIERAQFAPVQARYKVYAIDECLTGESLVLTSNGYVRIDDPTIKGKRVLSYNDALNIWEYKKVLRWLDRGLRQTLTIKTANREIDCTANHLIRTNTGWIQAKNVKEGMKILSPVPVVAECSYSNMAQIDVSADLLEDISTTGINSDKKHMTLNLFSNKPSLLNPSVLVGAMKDWISQNFCSKRERELKVFNLTGQDIHTEKGMVFGTIAPQNLLPMQELSTQKHWDLSMAPYLVTAPSVTPTNTVDFPDWLGLIAKSSKNGWHTKQAVFQSYDQNLELRQTGDLETHRSVVVPPVIPNSEMFLKPLTPIGRAKSYLRNGLIKLLPKVWHGGTWMMERCFVPETLQLSTYVLKDTQLQKIKLLPIGLQKLGIQQLQEVIEKRGGKYPTTTSIWAQVRVKNGFQISDNIQSPQWTTNLEEVELVTVNKTERVYDIEVEGNHNFVANGLLVHNCHMLSTAAFNALLKTLEEPPDRVVFILATTDPQRVLPTIISRCQRFDFRRIPLEAMVSHLQKIAKIESIPIQLEAITLVAQIAQGGLRDAESLLDQLSLLEGEITTEAVWDLVGTVPERDLLALLEAIAQDNSTQILEQVRRIMDRGREPLIVLQSLAGVYRDLLIAKTASDRRDLVALTATSWEKLQQLTASLPISHILAGQQHLRGAEVQIKNTTQPRLWLEVTLLGLLPSAIAAVNDAAPRHAIALPTPTSTPTTSPSTASKPTPNSPTSDVSSTPIPLNSQPSQTTTPSIPTSIPENNFPVTIETSTELSIKASTETIEHAPSLTADLETSWQELVSILLPAARGLLAEHGRFVEVTQTTVTIGLKNSALKKIAEPKRDEIAKSCEKVFKRPMQVVFAVIGAKATAKKTMTASPSAAPSITPSITPSATANLDVEPSPQPSVVLASHAKIDRPISTPSSGGTYPTENRPAPAQPDSPISNLPTGYIAKSPEELAIRNIAEFFNGQIVNWDDEPSDESSSDRQKSS